MNTRHRFFTSALLVLPATGWSQIDWNAPTGNWTNPANWVGGAVPPAGSNIDIENGGTATINTNIGALNYMNVGRANDGILDIQGGGSVSMNSWTAIGLGGGAGTTSEIRMNGGTYSSVSNIEIGADRTGTLTSNSGSFTASAISLGHRNGNGIVNQAGGTVTANNQLWIARNNNNTAAGATGDYNLSGGTLNVANGTTMGIFQNTTGTFDITGGTANLGGNLDIASNATSTATMTLDGGTANMTGGTTWVGRSGQGILRVNSGTMTNNANTWVGDNTGSNGLIEVNGGTYTAAGIQYIGVRGTGAMTVNGGVADINNRIDIGSDPGGSGTVDVNGGLLDVQASLNIGRGGPGTFNQTAGVTNVNSWVAVGLGGGTTTATANLSGGQFNANSGMEVGADRDGTLNVSGTSDLNVTNSLVLGLRAGTGTVNQTGGDIDVTANVLVGGDTDNAGADAHGQYTMSGGTLDASNLFIGNGAATGNDGSFDHTGGTATFNTGDLRGGNGVINLDTTGDINIANGVQTNEINFNNSLDVNGGTATSQANLFVGGGGVFMLTNDLNIGNGDPTGGSNTGNLNIIGSAQIDGTGTVAGATTVSGGQTLGGTGTLNVTGNTMITGGMLSPGEFLLGNDYDNTLNIVTPQIDLTGGSSWKVDFQGPTDTDLLDLDGMVNLNGVTLDAHIRTWSGQAASFGNIGATTGANGDFHWILDNDGTDPVSGIFANTYASPFFTARYPNATQFVTLGQPYAIFYDANFDAGTLTGGNDILLVAIPEPSRGLLLAIGLGGFLLRRRR